MPKFPATPAHPNGQPVALLVNGLNGGFRPGTFELVAEGLGAELVSDNQVRTEVFGGQNDFRNFDQLTTDCQNRVELKILEALRQGYDVVSDTLLFSFAERTDRFALVRSMGAYVVGVDVHIDPSRAYGRVKSWLKKDLLEAPIDSWQDSNPLSSFDRDESRYSKISDDEDIDLIIPVDGSVDPDGMSRYILNRLADRDIKSSNQA